MTVKIYRPEEIKDANLVSSTLPEPDASRGEVEWQERSLRESRITVSLQEEITDVHRLIDDSFLVLHRGDGTVGTQRGNSLKRISSSGSIINSLSLPRISNDHTTKYMGFTLFDDNIISMLRATKVGNSSADWEFHRVNVSLLSFSVVDVEVLNIGSDLAGLGADTQMNVGRFAGLMIFIKFISVQDGKQTNRLYRSSGGFTDLSDDYWDFCESTNGGVLALSYTASGSNFSLISTLNLPDLAASSGKTVESDSSNRTPINGRLSKGFGYFSLTYVYIESGVIKFNNFKLTDDLGDYGAYKSGDEVIVTDTHKRYRAIKNAIFTYPPDNSQDGGDWIEVSPTNRWAMFDGEINTKSRSESGHTVNLTPSYLFDSVSVFGCKNVTEVKLTVRNSANAIIFQRNEDMNDLIAALEWEQDPLNPDLFSEVTIDGIPTAAGAKIELQFIGNNIEVGLVTYGLSREIGESLSGLSQNYFDYSKVEYNDFGKLIYQERPIVKLNTYNILVEREKTRSVDRLINSYRGQNLVWSGSTGNGEALVTYGRAQRSPLVYEYPNINELEITVRGSI